MLASFRGPDLPSLRGPALTDRAGTSQILGRRLGRLPAADLLPSTVIKKLSHLESLYQQIDERLVLGGLDDALAILDVDILSSALGAYFLTIRNQPSVTSASEERWQVALQSFWEL